jgi:hypothetical protein
MVPWKKAYSAFSPSVSAMAVASNSSAPVRPESSGTKRPVITSWRPAARRQSALSG